MTKLEIREPRTTINAYDHHGHVQWRLLPEAVSGFYETETGSLRIRITDGTSIFLSSAWMWEINEEGPDAG